LQITRLVGWVSGGQARHSILAATHLAEDLVHLALFSSVQGVLLAAREPVRLRDLLEERMRARGEDFPTHSVSPEWAAQHAAGCGDIRWRHDVRLLGQDMYVSATDYAAATHAARAASVRNGRGGW
jgi:hypothetical protein